MSDQKPEAQAVADLVTKYVAPTYLDLDAGPNQAVVLPSGLALYSIKKFIDEYRTVPERRKGTATLKDLASFIAHANRFKDPHSALFADPETPSLVSVLNYHPEGNNEPRFGDHRGAYEFPMSDEWEAWTAKADHPNLSQADFATWIEDRIQDIADPSTANVASVGALGIEFASPSRVLGLSRGLSVRVDSRVSQVVKLQSGETNMAFTSEHKDEAGAQLKIPGGFLIAIPVFKNGPLYQLPVRLRYRVTGGAVVWGFTIYRSDLVFMHAFNEATERAQKETGLPLFVGSPE